MRFRHVLRDIGEAESGERRIEHLERAVGDSGTSMSVRGGAANRHEPTKYKYDHREDAVLVTPKA
jgi:hypothetical protein